jgi:hypothetical protein
MNTRVGQEAARETEEATHQEAAMSEARTLAAMQVEQQQVEQQQRPKNELSERHHRPQWHNDVVHSMRANVSDFAPTERQKNALIGEW